MLPGGFHRIRYYGLIANGERTTNLTRVRELLHLTRTAPPVTDTVTEQPLNHAQPTFVCRHCGATMIVVDILARVKPIRAPPQARAAP